jgi:hypothetical protein
MLSELVGEIADCLLTGGSARLEGFIRGVRQTVCLKRETDRSCGNAEKAANWIRGRSGHEMTPWLHRNITPAGQHSELPNVEGSHAPGA